MQELCCRNLVLCFWFSFVDAMSELCFRNVVIIHWCFHFIGMPKLSFWDLVVYFGVVSNESMHQLWSRDVFNIEWCDFCFELRVLCCRHMVNRGRIVGVTSMYQLCNWYFFDVSRCEFFINLYELCCWDVVIDYWIGSSFTMSKLSTRNIFVLKWGYLIKCLLELHFRDMVLDGGKSGLDVLSDMCSRHVVFLHRIVTVATMCFVWSRPVFDVERGYKLRGLHELPSWDMVFDSRVVVNVAVHWLFRWSVVFDDWALDFNAVLELYL